MILVVGATGMLGGMIAQQLLENDYPVRILVRKDSMAAEMAQRGMGTPAERLINAGAEPVYGDLKDRRSLDDACRDGTTVITTANSVLRGGDDTIESVDRQGTQNLIEAARDAGVSHFIYVSVLGSDVQSPLPLAQAKAICEADLQASGMAYTILQPDFFMEPWIGSVIGLPLQAGQAVTLVAPATHRHSFVSMSDVAAYAVEAVDHPAAQNAIIRIGGDDAYSWQEVVDMVGETVGQPIPVNYAATGDPIPLLPEAMVPILFGLETFDSYVNMNAASMVFRIQPTPLKRFLENLLTNEAASY